MYPLPQNCLLPTIGFSNTLLAPTPLLDGAGDLGTAPGSVGPSVPKPLQLYNREDWIRSLHSDRAPAKEGPVISRLAIRLSFIYVPQFCQPSCARQEWGRPRPVAGKPQWGHSPGKRRLLPSGEQL